MRDVQCPALTAGTIGLCRFCIWIAGGVSELCVKMKARKEMDEQNKFQFSIEPTQIIIYPERIKNMWRMYGKVENKFCKTCIHLQRMKYAKTYLKCNLNKQTHGAGTDWKAGWSACGKYEESK